MSSLGPVARMPRWIALVALLSTAACVEEFKGSWVILRLQGVHVPGVDNGSLAPPPPDGSHFEMWVYSDVKNEAGEVTGTNAFQVFAFRVVPVIDTAFPCFIELEDSKYPGLHVTQWYERHLVDLAPGSDPPSQENVNLLADAYIRRQNLDEREARMKAVVAYDPSVTPSVIAALEAQIDAEAPVTSVDDVSNARRLEVCQAFFEAHPQFYVGSDTIFSVPLSGTTYGLVEGMDPISMANVGGAAFTVPFSFEKFDTLSVNWQFDDPADPRIEQFGPSDTGYHYMSGPPEYRTRRTVNVEMRNQQFPDVLGHFAVFPNINDDQAIF